MANAISNYDNIIDSRDILDCIERLKGDDSNDALEELARLEALIAALEEAGTGDSPEDGITLIRDSYFEDYAQELAEDIGAISRNAQWPLYCIDWEAAARELQMDYVAVDFDGVTYWVR